VSSAGIAVADGTVSASLLRSRQERSAFAPTFSRRASLIGGLLHLRGPVCSDRPVRHSTGAQRSRRVVTGEMGVDTERSRIDREAGDLPGALIGRGEELKAALGARRGYPRSRRRPCGPWRGGCRQVSASCRAYHERASLAGSPGQTRQACDPCRPGGAP
jgi:hypothetical protein